MFPEDLRFGIHAGQQYTDFPSYLELWKTAEEIGLDWASVFDHFMPIQADPTGPCFEGMSLLAAMAAHTERLRCGIIVDRGYISLPGRARQHGGDHRPRLRRAA